MVLHYISCSKSIPQSSAVEQGCEQQVNHSLIVHLRFLTPVQITSVDLSMLTLIFQPGLKMCKSELSYCFARVCTSLSFLGTPCHVPWEAVLNCFSMCCCTAHNVGMAGETLYMYAIFSPGSIKWKLTLMSQIFSSCLRSNGSQESALPAWFVSQHHSRMNLLHE